MFKWLSFIFFVCVLNACAQRNEITKTSLQNYAIATASAFAMPKELKEISGITFADNDSMLYGEQDEIGNVYAINVKTRNVHIHNSIGVKGDFEDIAYAQEKFYLLRSDGVIFSFPNKQSIMKDEIKSFEHELPMAEYEGMCYQKASNSLFVLAKTIYKDHKHAFVYQLEMNQQGTPIHTQLIQLNISEWESKLGQKIGHFKPSAISYNAIDKLWFLLSSINHLIIVLNENWNFVDYASLDPTQYPQPEGLAFDQEGNLWIASEAGIQKHGRIYRIEKIK